MCHLKVQSLDGQQITSHRGGRTGDTTLALFTRRTRKVTICNLLTKQKTTIEVPVEETIEEIRDRYLLFNAHAKSYKWTRLGKPLDMSQTLEENGMKDETEEFMRLGIDPDDHIPVIHLHFLDDLTEA